MYVGEPLSYRKFAFSNFEPVIRPKHIFQLPQWANMLCVEEIRASSPRVQGYLRQRRFFLPLAILPTPFTLQTCTRACFVRANFDMMV